jgi:hypothetical protein
MNSKTGMQVLVDLLRNTKDPDFCTKKYNMKYLYLKSRNYRNYNLVVGDTIFTFDAQGIAKVPVKGGSVLYDFNQAATLNGMEILTKGSNIKALRIIEDLDGYSQDPINVLKKKEKENPKAENIPEVMVEKPIPIPIIEEVKVEVKEEISEITTLNDIMEGGDEPVMLVSDGEAIELDVSKTKRKTKKTKKKKSS